MEALVFFAASEASNTDGIAADEGASAGASTTCCLPYDLVFTSREALEDVGVVVPADGGRVSPSVFVNEVAVPALTSLLSPRNLKLTEEELEGQRFHVSEPEEYVLFRRDALRFVYGMCEQGGGGD